MDYRSRALAKWRGCVPSNDCWSACVSRAAESIASGRLSRAALERMLPPTITATEQWEVVYV